MKTRVEILLNKLSKEIVDNDKEFLACLVDLDCRLKKIENNRNPHLNKKNDTNK